MRQRAQAFQYEVQAPVKSTEGKERLSLQRQPNYVVDQQLPQIFNYRSGGEPRVQALFLLGTDDRQLPPLNKKAGVAAPAPADR